MSTTSSEQSNSKTSNYNPILFSENIIAALCEWQRIMQSANAYLTDDHEMLKVSDEELSSFQTLLSDTVSNFTQHPEQYMDIGMGMMQDYMQLWQDSMQNLMGSATSPAGTPPSQPDRRFNSELWQQSAIFDFIKRAYLVNTKWLTEAVHNTEYSSPHRAKVADFYTRQFIDAMAPTNFLTTNPEVWQSTVESNGETLLNGLRNLRADLERGQGKLRISMTDENAFELGRNLAITPGQVVFQNDLMQLIQYEASTKSVNSTPVLIIPAWINKYYVLDMQEKNSLVKWLVDQGHSVFMISWSNHKESLCDKSFDDYITSGTIAALEAIEQATGQRAVSTIGYCLGGTLLATTAAWLSARGEEDRLASATYLTTMLDFADAGELSVFIDEAQISTLEQKMAEKGYLEGQEMASTFNMLRANDLIWSFFINNYLLGKSPFPFDLLYWNADATTMPAEMHSFYLRNMYLHNKLKDGTLTIAGEVINLNAVKTPSYMLSCKDDHIAPWQSTYAATNLFGGDVTFTLSGSGHIAGVVNPPAKNKYCYWSNTKAPTSADAWLEQSEQTDGSWWTHWDSWQKTFSGEEIAARKIGSGKLSIIEKAPGSYVKER